MVTRRPDVRSAATASTASGIVSPATKRSTTLRVIGSRSAVRRRRVERAAARMAGRATRWNVDSKAPRVLAMSGLHVGVGVVGGRNEGLLDGAGRGPAQQVQRRTRLVVGARGPGATERLLADHRARGLVVDVEIACRVAQAVLCG